MEIVDPGTFFLHFNLKSNHFLAPFSMRTEWNPQLSNNTDVAYSNLFFLSPYDDENKLKFLKTVRCDWKQLKQVIADALEENNLGQFGPSVGIINKNGDVPTLIPIDTFFVNPVHFKEAKQINCIVLSSFNECKVEH